MVGVKVVGAMVGVTRIQGASVVEVGGDGANVIGATVERDIVVGVWVVGATVGGSRCGGVGVLRAKSVRIWCGRRWSRKSQGYLSMR
jgi:hypothetical protein